MAPGEVRQISLGTSIAATTTTSTGQQITTTLPLPPLTVAAEHIISLDPPSQTVDRAATATYTVSLTNPLSTDETYTLTTTGLGGLTVGLASSIAVPAGQTVTTPLDRHRAGRRAGRQVLLHRQRPDARRRAGLGRRPVDRRAATWRSSRWRVSLGLSPTQATAGQGGSAQYVLTVTNVGSVDGYLFLEHVRPALGRHGLARPDHDRRAAGRRQLPRRAAQPGRRARDRARQLSLHRDRDLHQRSDRDQHDRAARSS